MWLLLRIEQPLLQCRLSERNATDVVAAAFDFTQKGPPACGANRCDHLLRDVDRNERILQGVKGPDGNPGQLHRLLDFSSPSRHDESRPASGRARGDIPGPRSPHRQADQNLTALVDAIVLLDRIEDLQRPIGLLGVVGPATLHAALDVFALWKHGEKRKGRLALLDGRTQSGDQLRPTVRSSAGGSVQIQDHRPRLRGRVADRNEHHVFVFALVISKDAVDELTRRGRRSSR